MLYKFFFLFIHARIIILVPDSSSLYGREYGRDGRTSVPENSNGRGGNSLPDSRSSSPVPPTPHYRSPEPPNRNVLQIE